ncbi:MAG TPA: tRNA uridine-5-carboxymethylaminomethyl(34) synthesis GTPase MnmE [Rhodospirillaceae bacterium]|nr:tRNA uridine-5-carboxymethylaminomethyl(34) synthesis GTPase MnmE [Rhodospirillaceae bacterium]
MPSAPPTIVALSSALGRAGVAVVRVSGARAAAVFEKLCRPATQPEPRRASLRDVIDPATGELIDHALTLWFPAPHSFTGEDVVELHLHGGRAIIKAVIENLCRLDGFALAEAGEFSRRAFENGKMDLTEAEGIADLIDAETAAQRRQALRQMDGALGALYHDWADRLTHALAFIEAEIDFADEEIPPDIAAQRLAGVREVLEALTAHLNDNHRGERLREGFTVAILGAPNAGKSSLLNALAQREAAIVSPIAGTTRDVIEVQLDLGGYPVSLVDTAGLRESADAIESEGVRRALARADQADFKILLFDGSAAVPDPHTLALLDGAALVVVNKSDLGSAPPPLLAKTDSVSPLSLSVKTGEGLTELTAKLIHEIDRRFMPTAQPSLTRLRHRLALEECQRFLQSALSATQTELSAEDLRLAVRSLGRITGRVDVEDLLDIIFSSFCIGK